MTKYKINIYDHKLLEQRVILAILYEVYYTYDTTILDKQTIIEEIGEDMIQKGLKYNFIKETND